MTGRGADVFAVSAVAILLTAAIAAPVLRAPSDRIFGKEIVGRHHDPFTVMQQFGRPISLSIYSQPLTDLGGALIARLSGATAAYNWLVLLSFPLAAIAAYLLARHLELSHAAATVAALGYAFSPFHVAQAAYHPHIAQTQWIPLYLLALWRCLDHASIARAAWLAAATLAVVLSNFYGGLIAAVITPVAFAAYYLAMRRTHRHPMRSLVITAGTLFALAAVGLVYLWYGAGPTLATRSAVAFPRADLFRYSATWWSYLVPPVQHPVLGTGTGRLWTAAGVREGLLEQQVTLGWAVIALGLVAVIASRRPGGRLPSLTRVPVLGAVAVTALVCSLPPERTIGGFTLLAPSAFLHSVFPMFRSYARFGVVVQLMAVLLAGIGVEYLRRSGRGRTRLACAALLVLAAAEYAVSPSAMWRDVLPTAAHRSVVQFAHPAKVLDCTPLDQESESVQWLTGGRIMMLAGSISDCAEANLPEKLAANRYTHLLVRRDTGDAEAFAGPDPPAGLRLAARFDDAEVFEVTGETSPIHTAAMKGFFPRERDAGRSWRWMGADASWTVVNTSARPVVATLRVEMSAFHRSRRLEVRLDGLEVAVLDIDPSRRTYDVGPLTVSPGDHELGFHPMELPTVAGALIHNGDSRRLSFAVGTWVWSVRSAQP